MNYALVGVAAAPSVGDRALFSNVGHLRVVDLMFIGRVLGAPVRTGVAKQAVVAVVYQHLKANDRRCASPPRGVALLLRAVTRSPSPCRRARRRAYLKTPKSARWR